MVPFVDISEVDHVDQIADGLLEAGVLLAETRQSGKAVRKSAVQRSGACR